MVGGVLSSMVMTWPQVLLLPQASVAVQVRLMVYSCGQTIEAVVTSLKVTTGAGSQLSVAVAFPVLAGNVLAVHSMVIFAGQSVMTGAVLSSTTMVWTHAAVLPHASTVLKVRVMVYS